LEPPDQRYYGRPSLGKNPALTASWRTRAPQDAVIREFCDQSGRTISLALTVERSDGLLLCGLFELLERVGELFHEVRKGR
jgi:hypothetical protein